MTFGDSLLTHWYFHLPNMVLAALIYTLIGRYVLELFFAKKQQATILVVFRQITDPVRPPRARNHPEDCTRWVDDHPSHCLAHVLTHVPLPHDHCIWREAISRRGGLTMDDMQNRQDTMQKDVMLVATAGLSLMNGMTWSPVLFPFVVLLKALVAGTFLSSPLVLTYLASLLASATTLVIAGVPAALYERAKGLEQSSPISIGIWLAGTIALVGLPFLFVGG